MTLADPRLYRAGMPYTLFAQLRDEEPVSWQEEPEIGPWPDGPGFWAVTRYADVVQVSRTPEVFSARLGATQIRDLPPGEDLDFVRQMMLNMDPPEHGRLRRTVSKAFTPARVQRFAADVRARAQRLLDAAPPEGFDLAADVADEFPLLNLADLLGVPPSDAHLLLEWTNRVIGYQDDEHAQPQLGPDGRPVNPRSPGQLRDMFAYAAALAEHKRRHPQQDVMTALAHADLTDAQLQMFFFLLSVAGNDTVRSAVPGGVLALLDFPATYDRLRADPRLLPAAVEEMLRWHPPVISFRRTARTDTTLAGTRIGKGDKVVIFYPSAHRDPRHFPGPDRFDVTRTPNDHLAFGDGPHVCLGAHFARLQLVAFFEVLLARLPLAAAGPPVRLTSNFIAGIKHLPVTTRGTPPSAG